jgi:UrcA family protein
VIHLRPTFVFACAASAISLIAAPALAQSIKKDPVYYDAHYDDEITIVAPGVVRQSTGRRTSSGIPITDLVAQRVVTTDDLDLRSDADVDELHRRIHDTAEEACDEIDRASAGIMITSDRQCVREAVRDAMAQADALVYSARG